MKIFKIITHETEAYNQVPKKLLYKNKSSKFVSIALAPLCMNPTTLMDHSLRWSPNQP